MLFVARPLFTLSCSYVEGKSLAYTAVPENTGFAAQGLQLLGALHIFLPWKSLSSSAFCRPNIFLKVALTDRYVSGNNTVVLRSFLVIEKSGTFWKYGIWMDAFQISVWVLSCLPPSGLNRSQSANLSYMSLKIYPLLQNTPKGSINDQRHSDLGWSR